MKVPWLIKTLKCKQGNFKEVDEFYIVGYKLVKSINTRSYKNNTH